MKTKDEIGEWMQRNLTRKAKAKPRKKLPPFQWTKAAHRAIHPTLGVRLRWRDKAGRCRVERFPDYYGPYIAIVGEDVISEHRSLSAAKKAAEKLARERAQA